MGKRQSGIWGTSLAVVWAFCHQGVVGTDCELTGNGGLCAECGLWTIKPCSISVATVITAVDLSQAGSHHCRWGGPGLTAHTGLLWALEATLFLLTTQRVITVWLPWGLDGVVKFPLVVSPCKLSGKGLSLLGGFGAHCQRVIQSHLAGKVVPLGLPG